MHVGVTLEALSADEESMQHHYRSQPHRGREELPWRKKRSERRKTRQQERQASGDSLNAPAEPLPSAVLSSRAERYDSWTPESQVWACCEALFCCFLCADPWAPRCHASQDAS